MKMRLLFLFLSLLSITYAKGHESLEPHIQEQEEDSISIITEEKVRVAHIHVDSIHISISRKVFW